jgi:hypothetical protein
VQLNAQGVELENMFRQFNESGSGFLSHDEFTAFMQSLPVKLRNEQIRDIIRKVRPLDEALRWRGKRDGRSCNMTEDQGFHYVLARLWTLPALNQI